MPHPAALLALALATAAEPAPLTPQERAGRAIYYEGKSASGGAVNAIVSGTSLSAELVSCAGCHGEDGLGRPEGGVNPTPITWGELTKPWGRKVEGGRKHPPYDERKLARAITEGVDAGDNALSAAMPRYSMPRADMEALVAYVKRLGNEPVPGIGASEFRIGSILPSRGPLAGLGDAVRGVLDAWAAETNAAGGIHGRRVVLHVATYDPAREGGLDAAQELLARRDLLALVSGFTPTVEAELADLAEREGVPIVGPITAWPVADPASRHRVFYLLGGPREHARVLAAHALRDGGSPGSAVIVHARDERHADVARAARERLAAGGWTAEVVPFERGRVDTAMVAGLHARGAGWVIFLAEDDDVSTFLREAAARDWTPHVLASGALAARATLGAPAAFEGRIVLAMPTAPADESPSGREALARAARGGGAGTFHSARASGRAAVQVLAEGLRRAGRAVSREKLAVALEGLQSFETGVHPRLSFGPARRIGAKGSWLVAPDAEGRGFRVLEWAPEE
jgi:ABC-type branched-subunit amino acid transport system substrate-binding protein